MSEIVRIDAPKPFEYSHDNGISRLQYLPGQIYEIPDQSVRGMTRRGAVILDRKEIDAELAQAQPAGTLTGEGPQAGSDDAHDDESGKTGDEGGAKGNGADDAAKGKDTSKPAATPAPAKADDADKGKDASDGKDTAKTPAKTDDSKPAKPNAPTK